MVSEAPTTIRRERPWGLTLAAVVLIGLGPAAIYLGVKYALDGRYASCAGATIQGFANLTAGILILANHRQAILAARLCAILFTIAFFVHGLTVLDLIQMVFMWMGYFWYKSWLTRVETPIPAQLSDAEELAQRRELERFMGMSQRPKSGDEPR